MIGMQSDGRDHPRGPASISWLRLMLGIVVGISAALVFRHFWPLVLH
jgi:hypothetical protein